MVNDWDHHVLPYSPTSPSGSVYDDVASTTLKRKREDGGHARRPHLIQVPTPPSSTDSFADVEDSLADENLFVSVSTTFYPGAQTHSLPPDVTFITQDNVFFYVHSSILLSASTNRFRSLIPTTLSNAKEHGPIVNVSEESPIFNIILHTLYDMSCTHYNPTFQVLQTAIDLFPTYGLDIQAYISPQMPLFSHMLSYAPLFPIELYALASHYNLFDLAVSTSSHLLSYQLSNLSDDLVDKIGPRYLKRLFFLHIGRADALKRILLPPPPPHPPTAKCDFDQQKRLTRAWALASAYLAWEARPDLSVGSVESALSPLADHVDCDLCKRSLKERVKNLVVQWSVVKRTI
ncbi:hypothetical protein CYLTODRAFT_448692 [Cylindrobasidium torrendii FP15055 ss-10]|uniref:BTB domain-containing protein n=1 Tax=Cylindrobasidium torrendii FP15055 ss-10 TaxID=1314674 RepID=A0A0D7BVT3_9AGAR|nr:hypothetical protein CYLTODRAFT_448692 [Cylindrobasidium torrendii FP15055 ss-10]